VKGSSGVSVNLDTIFWHFESDCCKLMNSFSDSTHSDTVPARVDRRRQVYLSVRVCVLHVLCVRAACVVCMCVYMCVCVCVHPQNELVTNFRAIAEVLDGTFEIAAVTQNPPLWEENKPHFHPLLISPVFVLRLK